MITVGCQVLAGRGQACLHVGRIASHRDATAPTLHRDKISKNILRRVAVIWNSPDSHTHQNRWNQKIGNIRYRTPRLWGQSPRRWARDVSGAVAIARTAGTGRSATFVTEGPGCGDGPRRFGVGGVSWAVAIARTAKIGRSATFVTDRLGRGDSPRRFGGGGLSWAVVIVRTAGTGRSVVFATDRLGRGDSPRRFGGGGVSGAGAIARTAGIGRFVTFVTVRPRCGDSPRGSGGGGASGADMIAEADRTG